MTSEKMRKIYATNLTAKKEDKKSNGAKPNF